MATKEQVNEERRLQQAHLAQRRAINNAYAALLADQSTQTFQAFSFEDALDLQIERIEGSMGSQLRPNALERVARIENQLLQAVELLKTLPPEQFLEPELGRDVNTSEEPE